MDIFTIDKEYADRLYSLLGNQFVLGEDILSLESLDTIDSIKDKLKNHKAVTIDDLSEMYQLVCFAIYIYSCDSTPTICPGCGRIQTLKQQGLADLEDYFATAYGEAYKKQIGFEPDGSCGE